MNKKSILSLLLILMVQAAGFAVTATLNLTVKDENGNLIPDAKIMLTTFSQDEHTGFWQPDTSYSTVDTACDGTWTTSLVVEELDNGWWRDYQLLVTVQGYSPTTQEQMMNWQYGEQWVWIVPTDASTITKNVTLTSGLNNVDTVVVSLNYDQADKLYIGEIRDPDTWETVSMETFFISGTAQSSGLTFNNIPLTNEINPYRVNIYCPEDNVGMERFVVQMGTPVDIDLNQGGMAPPSGSGDEQEGNVVFEGVIETTSTPSAGIADARIMLVNTDNWTAAPAQTVTDLNGYYAFYDGINPENANYKIEIQAQGFEGIEIETDINGDPLAYIGGSSEYFNLGALSLSYVHGVISGTVTLDGVPLPNVYVNVWGDWDGWTGSDPCNHNGRGSGSQNADNGTFNITGLAPGNYRLEVQSEFTQEPYRYNQGVNRQDDFDGEEWSRTHTGDDLRINVDTETAPGFWITKVYDADGASVESEYPLAIDIPSRTDTDGTITGTITYDESILSSDVDLGGSGNMFIVIARQDWSTYDSSSDNENWVPPACGFTSIEGSETEFSYTINVPAGYIYQVEVKSKNYGVIRAGDYEMKADLRNGATSADGLDFIICPGGTIKGNVFFPDGTTFKPFYGDQHSSRGANVNAHGWNIQSWSSDEVRDDGSFEINGLVPGSYTVEINGWGDGFKWASSKVKDVNVEVGGIGQSTFTAVEIRLKPGVRCYPIISGDVDSLPEYIQGSVIGVEQGTKMTHETMKDILMDKPEAEFHYHDGYFDPMYLAYGTYDFYAVLKNDYEEGSDSLFFSFLGQLKNFEINEEVVKGSIPEGHSWSSGEAVLLDLNISAGNSALTGTLLGENIFRPQDAVEMAKNFDLFLEYIPSVLLYDSNGIIRAWSLEVPEKDGGDYWEAAAATGDVNELKQAVERYPPKYTIQYLPSGTYTFIAATPNYPPFIKQITINEEETITQNVNFDTDVGPGGNVSGVVKDGSSGKLLSNASIKLTSNVKNTIVRTDNLGRYEFPGLPKGTYTIQVSKTGYALSGAKRSIEKNASIELNFNLESAPGSFSGTVYLQKMPSPKTYSGAKIVAYNDTDNGENTDNFLPLYTAATDLNGQYKISGVVSGDTYKIFLNVDGKQLQYLEKTASTGDVSGCDFTLRSEAPMLDIKSKVSSDGTYITFDISSPKTLKSDPVCTYHEGAEFDEDASALSVTPEIKPNDEYRLTITPEKSDMDYVLRITADDGVNDEVSVDTVFNLSLKSKVKKELKSEYAQGGDVNIADNINDDPTSIGIPTGGLTAVEESGSASVFAPGITANAAVGGFISTLPGIQLSKTNRNASSILMNLIETVLASDLYTIDLSNAQVNRDLTISLNYDKSSVADLDGLKIYQYNYNTGQWDVVNGSVMADPITGTVSVDVNSVSNASQNASPELAGRSQFTGAKHVINPNASTDQTGTFAVFSAAPPNVKPYTGIEFKAYNFPNPFDLKGKTVTLTDDIITGKTMDTYGTIIKYYMPSSVSGKTIIYIYNIAGEMVREIDDGDRDGGYIYYTAWDGKNDNGSSVASGVYICMIQVDGKKKNLFKMAIIK
ncbi:MAG: carboxypeptidase regulatory-like domain-containing protein [bacterium]